MRISTFAPLVVAALALAGCADDGGDDTKYNCEIDDRDEPFTINLGRDGANGVRFTIVSADPVLPARGANTWTIDVTRDGQPVAVSDGMLQLTPFMPDHRHGAGVTPVWTPDPSVPGRYSVTPINLWMPGVWELTFVQTPTTGLRDQVLFTFCITG